MKRVSLTHLSILLVSLLFVLAACDLGRDNQVATQSSATPVPTDAPPTQTPTPIPTRALLTPCPSAPPTRLIVQERGQVTDTDERLNLRVGPGIDFRILTLIEPLEVFIVLEGPRCADGYAWYQIDYQGREGWIAEGDLNQYYAEPYLTG